MAHLLALEWDGQEARVAVARRRGSDVVLDHAFTVDLGPRDAGEHVTDAQLGERILAALSARQIGRCDTLVAVGRARIELRSLTLPPSPMEELPDLVRFQALRQFAAIGEDWPLDFVHLATGEEESFTVLAAAISPEMVKQIDATCAAAGQSPRRLVLRPFAAVSLLRRRIRDEACRLMVDLLAEEADLTVVADRQLVFMRTVRLPGTDDPQKRNTALLGEIRRTLVAAQNQLGGRRVEHVVLCGGQHEHADLKTRIAEALDLPVDVFDPLAEVQQGLELSAAPPTHPGRFAPLVGMLLDEAAGAPHAIDFLHPRKTPPPKNRRRQIALIGASVAAVVLTVVGLTYSSYASLGKEAEGLKNDLTRHEQTEQVARKLMAEAQAIDAWNQGDVVWLDELSSISERFPAAEKAMLTGLWVSAQQGENERGRYSIEGVASDPEVITDIERRLRDATHEVVGGGGQTDDQIPGYSWYFQKNVTVKPGTADAPASGTVAGDAGQGGRS